MTVNPSQWATFYTGVKTVFETALGTRRLYDGPPSAKPSETEYAALGWDGDPDDLAGGPAGDIDQQFAWISDTAKRETLSIVGAFVSWSGGDDFATERANAMDMFSDCEAGLRAALGNETTFPFPILDFNLSAGTPHQTRDGANPRVRVEFTITCKALI